MREAVQQVASLEEVESLRDEALRRRPYWFPIRHHSPACARHLKACIETRKPRRILVEGPWEANHLLKHLVDRQTRPPVAIYSSFRSEDNSRRCAAWFPLLEFSPEYVAVVAGLKVGAEVEWIDLPHYTRPHVRYQESLIETAFYAELVRQSHFHSWDEAWDSLFEVPRFADFEAFRAELALFCAAARQTAEPGRLQADGTLEREHFMLQRVLTADPETTLVVTGGFHMFYGELLAAPPPPAGAVYVTLVPYSYPRVTSQSGYAAGCRAPQFYERLWRATGDEVSSAYAVEVLREARRQGQPVSSADAIATSHIASLLRSLRGRAGVVLDDLDDALITCCCKGDPDETGQILLRAMARVARGERVGRVTSRVGQLPLLKDFHERLVEHDLAFIVKVERWQEIGNDLRCAAEKRRSAFLYRLLLLGVPIGQPVERKSGLGLFQEKWRLRWAPGIESALIENNLYGDTVESASARRLALLVEESGSQVGALSDLMVRWLGTELPHLLSLLSQACRAALALDGRFLSLARALRNFVRVEQHFELTGEPDPGAAALVGNCFGYACTSLPTLANAPADDHESVLEGLRLMLSTVVRPEYGLDRAFFEGQLWLLARGAQTAFLRGLAWGILLELRATDAPSVARELSALAQAPEDILVSGAEMVDGLMAASPASVLLEPACLVEALDELLRTASWDAFLTMLPRLRRAAERAGPSGVRALAEEVARRHGLRTPLALDHLPRSLNLVAVRIDEEVSMIMAEWEVH